MITTHIQKATLLGTKNPAKAGFFVRLRSKHAELNKFRAHSQNIV